MPLTEDAITDETQATAAFVLSGERCGSTLLRMFLDTHSSIWCPDELLLGAVATSLSALFEAGLETPVDRAGSARSVLDPQVRAATRELLGGLMSRFTFARGKRMWCDKSPHNIKGVELLQQVFP